MHPWHFSTAKCQGCFACNRLYQMIHISSRITDIQQIPAIITKSNNTVLKSLKGAYNRKILSK